MYTILIVEDNEMNKDMLARRLEKAGYNVLTAENGEEAVRVANEKKPHLILMDMSLPIMDGWQATRLLKGKEDTRKIPIIALTAHAMIDDLHSTIEAGCDDFDSKPVDFKRLLEKIGKFLLKPVDGS